MYERQLIHQLRKWSQKQTHKPLVIRGTPSQHFWHLTHKKVLILAGKAAPKVIREDRLYEILPKINKWPNSISHNETEETKNQVCCNIPSLLVCLSGLSGGWSPEIPNIGWLFRVIHISGNHIIALGHSTYIGGLYIHKRITAGN